MAPKQYVRNDRRIRVVLDGDRLSIEDLTGTQPTPDLAWAHRIGAAAAQLLTERQDEATLSNLVASSFVGADSTISRLVADLPATLAWADWEQLLRPAAQGRVVVRGVASRPAYTGVPLVVPLRALHLTYGRPAVQEWIDNAVGPRLMGGPTTGVVAGTGYLTEAPTILSRLRWPVADIIHVTEPYRWEQTSDWFDTLERLVRVAQCRLLVLEPANPTDRQSLLVVGHRIAGRGGPAVLVPGVDDTDFANFYADVLHDAPLDAAVSRLNGACLYGDQGREDGLRISAAGADLYRDLVVQVAIEPLTDVPPNVIQAFADTWESIEFSTSERDGLYRMAASVDELRLSFPRAGGLRGEPVQRQVEPALYDGPSRIPQTPRAPLRLRGLYHLRVGVTDDRTPTAVARPEPLLFERQLWDDADEGIWLEVGVTGIGWAVDYEPVQQLFIPKTGEAPPCWFAVRPTETGAPALRFTLFHNGHVIQSFRLAALVRDHDLSTPTGGDDEPGYDDTGLSAALDLTREEVLGRTWHARLEFSTVATLAQSRARPPRALSIVANDIAGKPVLTFKTAGQFEVRAIGNVDDYVSKSRALLDRLTFSPDTGNYRFGLPDGDRNAASPEDFAAALAQLADEGAKLYDALVPAAVRRTLPPLAGPPDTVQVASILREKVIPWALIYQGKYDPGEVEDNDGQIADHGTCTALLTAKDPDAFTKACGELRQCLLHPDMIAGRAAREEPPLLDVTVACPGRFWGFRHRIEAPPAQVPPDGTGTAAVDVVRRRHRCRCRARGERGPARGGLACSGTAQDGRAEHRHGAVPTERQGGTPFRTWARRPRGRVCAVPGGGRPERAAPAAAELLRQEAPEDRQRGPEPAPRRDLGPPPDRRAQRVRDGRIYPESDFRVHPGVHRRPRRRRGPRHRGFGVGDSRGRVRRPFPDCVSARDACRRRHAGGPARAPCPLQPARPQLHPLRRQ